MVNRYEAEEDFYGTPADWAELEAVMPVVSGDDVDSMYQSAFWDKVNRIVAETGRDESDVVEMLEMESEMRDYDY